MERITVLRSYAAVTLSASVPIDLVNSGLGSTEAVSVQFGASRIGQYIIGVEVRATVNKATMLPLEVGSCAMCSLDVNGSLSAASQFLSVDVNSTKQPLEIAVVNSNYAKLSTPMLIKGGIEIFSIPVRVAEKSSGTGPDIVEFYATFCIASAQEIKEFGL